MLLLVCIRINIGYVEYKLNGGSMSLDMSKWASTESKMRPILEELLSKQDKKKMLPYTKKTKVVNKISNSDEKFKKLKKLYSDGLITNKEYENKRKKLLENYID